MHPRAAVVSFPVLTSGAVAAGDPDLLLTMRLPTRATRELLVMARDRVAEHIADLARAHRRAPVEVEEEMNRAVQRLSQICAALSSAAAEAGGIQSDAVSSGGGLG